MSNQLRQVLNKESDFHSATYGSRISVQYLMAFLTTAMHMPWQYLKWDAAAPHNQNFICIIRKRIIIQNDVN